jgi:translation initiation factor IF-2
VFEFKGAKKSQTLYIAGCSVILGTIRRGDDVQIFRDGKMIHEADIHNLKHFKENVKTVKFGQECGISLGTHFFDMKEGDEIVSVNKKQVKRTLDEQTEEEGEEEEEN